ncbi:SH3 domain-containing protein [Roseibium hamelinense]|uniref:SH3 domain-containing protein n=1 Tax=Roseibium hamelinense TaxID=150831 RepID=A0A562SMB2_9HYPH|nr:SH3 domain-containing protein [Roseibium hamelinense]MTI43284.1 hypothetical protein [Roseibium hamelinense]TWI81786.1 SH3 domain-containing protein [Roseibium hamelinense]
MTRCKSLLAAALFLLVSPAAFAQSGGPFEAISIGNVNFRAGPGTNYPVITTVPRGQPVFVFRCTSDYRWCDSAYAGARGWVSAQYIGSALPGPYYGQPYSRIAGNLGVPRLAPNYPVFRAPPPVVYQQPPPVYRRYPPRAYRPAFPY